MLDRVFANRLDAEGGFIIDRRTNGADVKLLAVVAVAVVMIGAGALLALWMLHSFVYAYWGDSGVRLTAYVVGGVFAVLGILSIGYVFFYMAQNLTSNLMAKIVLYLSLREAIDDRGEVNRIMAMGLQAAKDGNHDSVALARDMVRNARQLSREQNSEPQFDFGGMSQQPAAYIDVPRAPAAMNGHSNGHAGGYVNGRSNGHARQNGKRSIEDLL